jgi:hypothetical protein
VKGLLYECLDEDQCRVYCAMKATIEALRPLGLRDVVARAAMHAFLKALVSGSSDITVWPWAEFIAAIALVRDDIMYYPSSPSQRMRIAELEQLVFENRDLLLDFESRIESEMSSARSSDLAHYKVRPFVR